mmetsp:Transcript_34882/g.89252  ORF Transcript_34882/g.89252 Transcript_34882/m.89252 type:complete len:369 (+) Transcript_34882:548-1654(+)
MLPLVATPCNLFVLMPPDGVRGAAGDDGGFWLVACREDDDTLSSPFLLFERPDMVARVFAIYLSTKGSLSSSPLRSSIWLTALPCSGLTSTISFCMGWSGCPGSSASSTSAGPVPQLYVRSTLVISSASAPRKCANFFDSRFICASRSSSTRDSRWFFSSSRFTFCMSSERFCDSMTMVAFSSLASRSHFSDSFNSRFFTSSSISCMMSRCSCHCWRSLLVLLILSKCAALSSSLFFSTRSSRRRPSSFAVRTAPRSRSFSAIRSLTSCVSVACSSSICSCSSWQSPSTRPLSRRSSANSCLAVSSADLASSTSVSCSRICSSSELPRSAAACALLAARPRSSASASTLNAQSIFRLACSAPSTVSTF